ncbi:RidA family protein [Sphingomonas sediminicola]|uniref:RidA family protein n=1 Tax=Sphingomonas sediminicola TaxID=386874 RepID=UPI001FEC938A|nr:RidA family protein [Sphingomonas sediminicola]
MAASERLFKRHGCARPHRDDRRVVGWNERQEFVDNTLAGQFAQTLRNIVAILQCDGAYPKNIARLTCYVTSIDEYLASAKEIGAAWREIMGRHYPAMALVEVVRLVEREAKVEIEATAVVPE